jgi:lipoprotein-releasing system ATP-binding protein
MSEALLRVRGLTKSYVSGERKIEVLRGLDLEVAEGEAVAIVGESGVGKSTLLHLLGGLDRPEAGLLTFRGRELLAGSTDERAAHRNRNVGFIFQFHHLLPELSALENVDMPLRIGRRPLRGSTDSAALLARMGLAHRLSHRPAELSGGEQQRVAIARALAARPALVLADEPTGNLDPATGAGMFRLLRDLQRERPFALVLATHNERLAQGCDRVMRLEAGRLLALDERGTREYFDSFGAPTARDPML